jgi:ABC-type uncharacterized transport system permease subunit
MLPLRVIIALAAVGLLGYQVRRYLHLRFSPEKSSAFAHAERIRLLGILLLLFVGYGALLSTIYLPQWTLYPIGGVGVVAVCLVFVGAYKGAEAKWGPPRPRK